MYYDSNKTRETFVNIGHFIHSGVFMCFYKIVFMGTQVAEHFQFRVSGSQNNWQDNILLLGYRHPEINYLGMTTSYLHPE